MAHLHAGDLAIRLHVQHFVFSEELHPQAFAGLGQTKGEFVDVAGGVALCEIAAVVLALQCGFDGFHLVGRHGAARQAALGQQLGDFARVVKALFVTVDVQDAFALVVKLNALGFGPSKVVLTRFNGQLGRGDGVVFVLGDGSHELGHPAELVPSGGGVHQQGRIAFEHPLEALDEGGRVGPDFGVGGRQLAAVGIGRFHAGVAVFFDQGDLDALLGQGVSGCDAGDAAANDDQVLFDRMCHGSSLDAVSNKWACSAHLVCCMTPSV